MKQQTKKTILLIGLAAASIIPVWASSMLTFKTSLQEVEQNLAFYFVATFITALTIIIVATWIGTKASTVLKLDAFSKEGYFTGFFTAISLALVLVIITVLIKTYTPSSIILLPSQPLKFIFLSVFYQGITIEIIFRWFCLSGIAAVLTLAKLSKKIAMITSLIVSSIIASYLSIPTLAQAQIPNIQALIAEPALILALTGLFVVPNMAYGILFWKKSLAVASFTHILTFLLYNFIIYTFLRTTIL